MRGKVPAPTVGSAPNGSVGASFSLCSFWSSAGKKAVCSNRASKTSDKGTIKGTIKIVGVFLGLWLAVAAWRKFLFANLTDPILQIVGSSAWLANIAFMVFANWRDQRNESLPGAGRNWRSSALVLALCSYAAFAVPVAWAHAARIPVNPIFALVSWLLAFAFAAAAFIAGMNASGWSRVAALVSSTIMIGYFVTLIVYWDV